MIDSKIVRGAYIGAELKKIIEEKWIQIIEIAAKAWTSQPNVSNALNAKKSFSDDFFRKIAEAIPLTDIEIKKIFQRADQEEYRYKYWTDIEKSDEIEEFKKMTREEQRAYFLKQMAFSVSWKNRDAFIEDVDKTIDFFLEKYK